jgi:hypothetical protein
MNPSREGTREVNGNSTISVVVEGGGEQVVAHVGLHALGAFADRLGLGDSLSGRIPITGERLPLHDRGKVLTQAMLMLAGGGEACADIEHVRAQAELFGAVPSDSTLYRTFRQIDADTLAGLWEAMAEVRAAVWRRSSATTGTDTTVLDIDSSLHQIHSENKEETAANYKGGFGFHPIFCFADATGEMLAVRLRPGNAGANNIADHVAVLDAAIAQLPDEMAVGHRPGDDPSLVRRGLPGACRLGRLHRLRVASPGPQRRLRGGGPLERPGPRRHQPDRVRRRRLAAGATPRRR